MDFSRPDNAGQYTTIDWTIKASMRAKLWPLIKRVLPRYGDPLDKRERETRTAQERTEQLAQD